MRFPPIKAIEAVKTRNIDGRTRHAAVRFRDFFRCLDSNGADTTAEHEIVKITLTPRAERYWDEQHQGRHRIPGAQVPVRA